MTVNIGIIGASGIAKNHANTVLSFPGRARLVAIADLDAERLGKLAEGLNVKSYHSAERLIADGSVDCVVICLPHHIHAEWAVKAAQGGKHILLEKPMATTVEDCDRIIEAVENAGVKLSVGQSYRYHNAYYAAGNRVRGGELGDLVFAVSTFNKSWGIDRRVGWAIDRNRGGGMWWANGIHAVNSLQWIANSPVVAVKGYTGQRFHSAAQMNADDASFAMLQHANGVHTVAVVLGYQKGAPKDMLEIACTGGMLRADRNRLWEDVEGKWVEQEVPARHDKEREWEDFLDYLEGKAESPIPGSEARETVRVMEAVTESTATGREVRID
jgi:predicted dehydrogenase